MTARPTRVLFVCMGNICRSPTAHGVFEAMVQRRGLGARISVASAGTERFHVGDPPDRRTQAHALERGYDLSGLRARQVSVADVEAADFVLAMDRVNLAALAKVVPEALAPKVQLFLDYAPGQPLREVPDPYYGGPAGFETVLDLCEAASEGLLAELARRSTG